MYDDDDDGIECHWWFEVFEVFEVLVVVEYQNLAHKWEALRAKALVFLWRWLIQWIIILSSSSVVVVVVVVVVLVLKFIYIYIYISLSLIN